MMMIIIVLGFWSAFAGIVVGWVVSDILIYLMDLMDGGEK